MEGILLNDTRYAGEAASQFIVKTMTEGVTIDQGHAYVQDGIKKSFTIPRFGLDEEIIQDRAATPTPNGAQGTVDGQELAPQDYMIYWEFNPRIFEAHWQAHQTGNLLLDAHLPQEFEAVVINEALKINAKFINKLIWNGQKSATGTKMKYIDGWLKKAMLSADTIDVSSPTTLSAANIVAELQKGYDAIPEALRYEEDMKIFVSSKTYDFYDTAQKAQANKGVDFTQRGKDTFNGLKVVRVPDFPNDVYYIAKGRPDMASNLWVGMNSQDDETYLQLEKKQANSEVYFVKGLMKIDAQVGWFQETVLYGTI